MEIEDRIMNRKYYRDGLKGKEKLWGSLVG